MSNEVSIMESLNNFMLKREAKFAKMNVSKLNFAAECDFARQALMKNEYLLDAARGDQVSLADAITNVAAIGISLNPASRHAYLVPRKIGKNKHQSVCLDISYMGMIRLATDTGIVKYMKAELVYKNDDFTYHGFDKRPDITVSNPFDTEARGELLGCIAWAKLNSGDYLSEFMTLKEIDAIRDDTQSYKAAVGKGGWQLATNVWVKHEGEMQKKTVIKRLYKTLPASDGSEIMSKAIEVLNEHEGIEFKPEPPELHYTLEQSEAYKNALDSGDYVGLLCVNESMQYEGQNQLSKLHESDRYEKGGKGRYFKMMEDNLATARDVRDEAITPLRQACDSGDDVAVLESVGDDLNQFTVDWYCQKLNPEQEAFARSVLQSAQAKAA